MSALEAVTHAFVIWMPVLFLLQRTIPWESSETSQRLDDEARFTRSRLWVRSGLFLRKSVNFHF